METRRAEEGGEAEWRLANDSARVVLGAAEFKAKLLERMDGGEIGRTSCRRTEKN
jgi:hypothetical protein